MTTTLKIVPTQYVREDGVGMTRLGDKWLIRKNLGSISIYSVVTKLWEHVSPNRTQTLEFMSMPFEQAMELLETIPDVRTL